MFRRKLLSPFFRVELILKTQVADFSEACNRDPEDLIFAAAKALNLKYQMNQNCVWCVGGMGGGGGY
jgi:hypothetical protein